MVRTLCIVLVCVMLNSLGCVGLSSSHSSASDLSSGSAEIASATASDPDSTISRLIEKAESAESWLWAVVVKMRAAGISAAKIAEVTTAAIAIPDYIEARNFSEIDKTFNTAWALACNLLEK